MNVKVIKQSFKSGKNLLQATEIIPQKGNIYAPGVVFYHGWSSSQKSYIERAKFVANKGIVCLTFSFSGCGESEGELEKQTITEGIQDGLAAYDFLVKDKKFVDPEKIGLCGASWGGYIAAIVCGERKVKSLVLRAPALYKNEWKNTPVSKINDEERLGFRLRKNFSQNNFALKAISEFKGSLLIIKGEKDEVIPESFIHAYFQAATQTKEKQIFEIKGAGHRMSDPKWNQEFVNLTTSWFQKTL